ncbi:MAG: helix-turn-helix transcriptional regulator [Eubacteriales bacterium]|nr:helix-turn-helix transcriptional regulator [Eubacteriales bacterium]
MKERIKAFRQHMHWTQADFAAHIGVTRNVVASWEIGRVQPPETVLRFLTSSYSVNYDWLVNGREPMMVPRESVTLDRVDRLLDNKDPLCQAVLTSLAELPPEAWETIGAFVDRLHAAMHEKA